MDVNILGPTIEYPSFSQGFALKTHLFVNISPSSKHVSRFESCVLYNFIPFSEELMVRESIIFVLFVILAAAPTGNEVL